MKREPLELDSVTLLRELVAEVRGLRSDLQRQHQRPGNETLAVLLRAIHHIGGDCAFSVAELLEQARAPEAATLHDAVVAAAGALNSKKLGQFLRTFEGVPADGLEVRRLGMDKQGVVWAVKARAF